jgi:hypothetical protein
MLKSRSPYSVSANDRGIGVADIKHRAYFLWHSGLSLFDAEPMLVDRGETELRECRRLHERVGADDEHRLSARQAN